MKPKRYPIALNLPRVVALLIVFGRHVVQSMLNNLWFPNPNPTMADVAKRLDDLESAEATVRSGLQGSVEARDLAEKAVVDDMVSIKGHVGQIAAQNPGQALLIIASAGLMAKRLSTFHRAPFSAAMTAVPQEVILRAKALKRRAAYEWQVSADGGKSWSTAGFTTLATLRVPGLTVGNTYQFRFRSTVQATTGDWSQTISLVVR